MSSSLEQVGTHRRGSKPSFRYRLICSQKLSDKHDLSPSNHSSNRLIYRIYIEKLVNKQILLYFVSCFGEKGKECQYKRTRSIIRSLGVNFCAYEFTEA